MHIFVGSTNPVKINAVVTAASETWPEATVIGISVPSGVSDQPRTDQETYQGAANRAQAVLAAGLMQEKLDASELAVGIGLEGGVFERDDGQLWSTVWAVVCDQQQKLFSANGARFQVPEIIAKIIQAGQEMGPVVEKLVGESDIRSKQGMIGVITQSFVDRTEEYSGISKMALGLYYGQGWDEQLQTGV